MTGRIFRSTIFVAAVVLLCSLGIIMGFFYEHYSNTQTRQLRDELLIAAAGTEQKGIAFLQTVQADHFRLTWIAADGGVLYDTQAAAAEMENHASREEVQEALDAGAGSSVRKSATLPQKTVYEATRLADGTVLRISTEQITAGTLLLGMLYPAAVVMVIAVALSAVLAARMAKKVVEPLNRLNLEKPLENDAYEELAPLLRRINQQHLQIDAQLRSLKRKTGEFEQIIRHMKEGLVLLDKDTNILSINSTARVVFGADSFCVGKSFLSVDRSSQMRQAVNDALDMGHGTLRRKQDGRQYQIDVSRIEADGQVEGAVLLAVDVTEAATAEATRREFSANVSHELKTPLQTIIGSAELLENGLVKPEDTARFVGHIRKEAARLLALVEDIIRLSQLDEGIQISREAVDLPGLCREAAQALEGAVRGKDVEMQVSGGDCVVTGVRRLLYELIYNLCDNAVKYNVPGGKVWVTANMQDGQPVLTVRDTGIGIPPEHQGRVFERFYRVDKSHSRQSGGTGLGLSIVKHAAQYHNAKLTLSSIPGEGTTITVTF